ncbi:structural maintenance of chromosomes protein 6 isoform X2 [Dendroctonus ponderosae]|uniref:structural maintenance of chromosomes protein 6 isoform X2 n=1 Tax=Dendroctonus ponderosae TaxID=77166 RepID=UPI0020364882|nr:structural maintenance of chromosomes protein 6 isoform X2 [Dendroctonus ponderosae]
MSSFSQSSRKRKGVGEVRSDESNAAPKKSKLNSDHQTCLRRAGTINHMTLKNFMCHSNFEIDFTKHNVSMVIGKNGSGKSAILTALIVGLGGKASLTNRGSSVKSFVKAGQSSGSVEIELCNEGPMAYKPRIYGKTITVVRNISASGAGSYRVKSETNSVISTQAKELLNITSTLNIQVDNPVCLLTQDTSRNFLSSNDPKNKFKLFTKATKLEDLEVEYKTTMLNQKESVHLLADKKTKFANLQEEMLALKKKIDGHQSIISIKEKKLSLQNEMLWAQVKDLEDELVEEQEKVDKIIKRLEEFKADTNKKAQQMEAVQESINNYERQIADINGQLEIQKGPLADSKKIIDELQIAYNEERRKKHALAIEIVDKVKNAEYLKQEIANANKNMSEIEQQKKDRLGKLAKLEDRFRSCGNHIETINNELFQIKSDIDKKQGDARSLKTEISHIANEIANEESSLRALERESGNTLMIYDRNMPKVIEMIMQQKNSFQHEPKGPLGSYLKLKEKKWAVAVEGYLGRGVLSAFTVDNQKDGKLLQQIFGKCLERERQPTIITSRFINRKHDVSRNLVQAPPDCVPLYNALIINDPVVSNCIVDQSSLENILLISSEEKAMELMSDRDRVPKNCKQGLTIKGNKYYPDPNYKTYASTCHQARYLQVDTQSHVQAIKNNIENLNNQKQAIQSQLQSLEANIKTQQSRQKELEDKLRKVTLAKQKIRTERDELSNEAEPEVHNLHNLENELEEILGTLTEKNAILEQTDQEIRELQSNISEEEEKMGKFKKASKVLEERLWQLQEQLRTTQSEQRQHLTSKEFNEQRLKEFQRKVDHATSAVVLKQAEIDTKSTNAAKFEQRPAETRPVRVVANELSEISRTMARRESQCDNIEEVTEQYTALVAKYKSVAESMKSLYADLKELNKAVDLRKKHYKLTENYFLTFIKHSFKKVLELRQFKGSIEINMEQKTLTLIVMPQRGSQVLTATSNLSGGERSYSTVAFLYALWQCMDFPFYFLDEFDVYMDKLNRTKVIDILLHYASSKPDLQFVFLTPQDVSFLQLVEKNVNLLRLEDPERFNL